MGSSLFRACLCLVALSASAFAQGNQPSPAFPSSTMPALPPGIGPQPAPNDANGLPRAPGVPAMPMMPGAAGAAGAIGAPAGIGAHPVPNEPAIPTPTRHIPIPSGSSSLISALDSSAVYVQAFDFVLMLVAGLFCLRARRQPGLTILVISCFVSALILFGFFLFGFFHGQGAFPQAAYIAARLLAPFELLLFAIGLILVARQARMER